MPSVTAPPALLPPGGLDPARLADTIAHTPDKPCDRGNPDRFFPVNPHTGDQRRQDDLSRLADRLCRGCDARTACLALAILNGDRYAIAGGTTPHDRARIRASVTP